MPFGPIVEPGPATQPGRRGVRVQWGGRRAAVALNTAPCSPVE